MGYGWERCVFARYGVGGRLACAIVSCPPRCSEGRRVPQQGNLLFLNESALSKLSLRHLKTDESAVSCEFNTCIKKQNSCRSAASMCILPCQHCNCGLNVLVFDPYYYSSNCTLYGLDICGTTGAALCISPPRPSSPSIEYKVSSSRCRSPNMRTTESMCIYMLCVLRQRIGMTHEMRGSWNAVGVLTSTPVNTATAVCHLMLSQNRTASDHACIERLW